MFPALYWCLTLLFVWSMCSCVCVCERSVEVSSLLETAAGMLTPTLSPNEDFTKPTESITIPAPVESLTLQLLPVCVSISVCVCVCELQARVIDT